MDFDRATPAPGWIVDVVFDVRAGGADAVYTYWALPELEPGDLVLAPLGGRTLPGAAIRVYRADEASLGFPLSKLKPLEGLIEGSRLPPAVLDLARYVADAYLAPLSSTFGLALPPGIAAALETEWSAAETPPATALDLTAGQAELLERIRNGSPYRPAREAAQSAARTLRLLEAKGWIRRTTRVAVRPVPKGTAGLYRLTANEDLVDQFLRDQGSRRPIQALALLRLRDAERSSFTIGDLQATGGLSASVAKALVASGLLEPVDNEHRPSREAPRPNSRQKAAIEALRAAQDPFRTAGFLLYGVTGSGKTEVYLRAAAEALRHGRQVLYLVPEIALTTQVIGQLRERFGERVAVLHSELNPAERLENWRRIAEGSAPVVLGARSALFAPLANIGLIVMDEEHEGSYKQESTPRYHSRALVRFLAERHGCPYVLGSATPSIESFHAALIGEIQLLELPSRTASSQLPEVMIEDLADGYRRGEPALLTAELQRQIEATLERGEQAILFLNRRAYSPFLICRECGHFFTCPRCAVSLTYSRRQMRLRCHHCGHQERPPDVCPKCSGRRLQPFGVGTEKVEEAVRNLLPDARAARLDRDVAQRKGVLEATLAAFGAGEIDVLVGTQIVAKGLNFPNVTLVGVVAADVSLNLPDFRAAERTFQLLSQVAGRAGRGASPGRVVIQTFNPGHIAVQCARHHDYRAFYDAAIEARREARYPPFVRLANIVFSGASLAEVIRTSNEAAGRLRRDMPEVEWLGPADCPIERLQNRWRKHLLAKLPPGHDHRPIAETLIGSSDRAVQIVVDIDPISLV